MIKIFISTVGGILLAVSDIWLLWYFVKQVINDHRFSLGRGILFRLSVAGGIIGVWLHYFHAQIFSFLLSFSVSYFLLVWFWEHHLWRREGNDGRTL